MTTSSHCPSIPASRHMAQRPWVLRFLNRLLAAQALHRQHIALSRLNDALLCDIGVTRSEANTEAARSAWDAPTHWRG